MGHTPYGYRIENGRVVIDEKQAQQVRDLFERYILGLSLKDAAEKAGLKLFHGSAGRILRNRKYLGDEYYPAIIDSVTFDKAEEERLKRAKSLGRLYEKAEPIKAENPMSFTIPKVQEKYTNPFQQAEYAYSLIECEV
ncbi:recombinase [Anaerotignum sp.]|uniref:recombinase n=1 Tax=Anaerotignum sp. TaxID=2039241 RepID=UPI002896C663|nr:recombinase [Anaerotignum sp.]